MSERKRAPRVTVAITITAEVPQVDNGYLGGTASIEEHVRHAVAHVTQHMQFGVKEGGTDWRTISAKVHVDRVIIEDPP